MDEGIKADVGKVGVGLSSNLGLKGSGGEEIGEGSGSSILVLELD